MVVVPRRAETLDAVPHSVAPLFVAVGEQLFVDLSHRLFDARHRVGRERECQLLSQIPLQLELTVPIEVFADRYGHFDADVSLVARLQFVVVARHVGQEIERRRQVVELPILEEFQVFRLALDARERLKRLEISLELILENAAIVDDEI